MAAESDLGVKRVNTNKRKLGLKNIDELNIAGMARQICRLPERVAVQVRSSCVIVDVTDVIIGLLKNSLEADATRVEVVFDLLKGDCIVEDNGTGITPEDMNCGGGLGKPYHTSRSEAPFDDLYGRAGLFLSSLGSLAFLEVISRHETDCSTNSLTVHMGEVNSRSSSAKPLQALDSTGSGTKVTVRNLFGRYPVRTKRRAEAMESPGRRARMLLRLRTKLASLLLAWRRPVVLHLKNKEFSNTVHIRDALLESHRQPHPTHLPRMKLCATLVETLLSQLQLTGSRLRGSWTSVFASSLHVSVTGLISTEPLPSRQLQFLSFGGHPVDIDSDCSVLARHINDLFAKSKFGNFGYDADASADRTEAVSNVMNAVSPTAHATPLKSPRKSNVTDRWPAFVFTVEGGDFSATSSIALSEPLAESVLQPLLQVLDALIIGWLKEHGYQNQGKQTKSIVGKRNDVKGPISSEANDRTHLSNSFEKDPCLALDIPSLTRPQFSSRSAIKMGRAWQPAQKAQRAPLSGHCRMKAEDYRMQSVAEETELKRSALRQRNDLNEPSQANLNELMQSYTEQDKLIEWRDPATNLVHWINARTGQIDIRGNTRQRRFHSNPKATPHDGKTIPQSPRDLLGEGLAGQSQPEILRQWNNPVFLTGQEPLRRLEGPASYDSTCGSTMITGTKLSKRSLRSARVIAQVDRKYVLAAVPTVKASSLTGVVDTLILIDQHAADERCKVEDLLAQLCCITQERARKQSEVVVEAYDLASPIVFQVDTCEEGSLRLNIPYFRSYGIFYDVVRRTCAPSFQKEEPSSRLIVSALPGLITARCEAEPTILLHLIRQAIWHDGERTGGFSSLGDEQVGEPSIGDRSVDIWLKRLHHMPEGMKDLINSRACRNAIMFQDKLHRSTCEELVDRLSTCVFPFQCAHGRPSLVPLLDLDRDGIGVNTKSRDERTGFFARFDRWQDKF